MANRLDHAGQDDQAEGRQRDAWQRLGRAEQDGDRGDCCGQWEGGAECHKSALPTTFDPHPDRLPSEAEDCVRGDARTSVSLPRLMMPTRRDNEKGRVAYAIFFVKTVEDS